MGDNERRGDPILDGMTLNERLFEVGLLEAFDKAILAKDKSKVIDILTQVRLTKAEAENWVDFALDLTLWQKILPEKLREHNVLKEFEEAIRKKNSEVVRALLARIGAPEKAINGLFPGIIALYFFNYTNLPFEEKEKLAKEGFEWMRRNSPGENRKDPR